MAYSENGNKIWYAVVDDDYDAWDRGSSRKAEAVKMAKRVRRSGGQNVSIVVIDDGPDPFCIDVIYEF